MKTNYRILAVALALASVLPTTRALAAGAAPGESWDPKAFLAEVRRERAPVIPDAREIILTSAGAGRRVQCRPEDNPFAACIGRGYSPGDCAGLPDACSPGQAACLRRGWSPADCRQYRDGYGRCTASDNPYAVCIERGWSASDCSRMVDGCAAGQAACLGRGWSPGDCRQGQRGYGRCTGSDNPYAACIGRGWGPSDCSKLVDGCSPGQAACIARGWSPSDCAAKTN